MAYVISFSIYKGGTGKTVGGQFAILAMADSRQMYPALAGNGAGQYFLAWQDDRNGNWDIYGQPFQHLAADFTASPTSGPAPLNVSFTDTSQPTGVADEWAWDFGDSGTSAAQNPNHTYTSPGEYTVSLTITDTDTGETDTVIKTNYISAVTTGTTSLITTTIVYTYDNLYRLTDAVYSGGITATYEYHYDATGNRTAYTTTITSTEVITYLYDNANRLVESVVIGGDTTTYTWDNTSRLITTTVAGQVSRVYDYSQDGDLITATVDSLVTAFAYDGDGRRLLMSVAGEVTTYTLDYAFSAFRILFEDGPTNDKHYLYGVQCIAEVVDEGTSDEEWRYYQRDGSNMVRQTTNETAEVTLAWTYTPEGMVLVGEEGPVTYLDCGTGGIYDWSTRLIFKNSRFFDPSTGIWITLSGVVVYNHVGQAHGRKRKSRRGKNRRILLLLLLIIVATVLTGCDSGDPTPGPSPTATCTPTATPTLPPVVVVTPEPSTTPTGTNTPTPSSTPTNTPSPSPTPELSGFMLQDPFGVTGGGWYWVCEFGATYCGAQAPVHQGLDLVPKRYIEESCHQVSPSPCIDRDNLEPRVAAEIYRDVYAPVTGLASSSGSTIFIDDVRHNVTGSIIEGLEVQLDHVRSSGASSVTAGVTKIGEIIGYGNPPRPHLHLQINFNGVPIDPLPYLRAEDPNYNFEDSDYYFKNYIALPVGV